MQNSSSWSDDAVVVVGAGISGVACARRLASNGLAVVVLDRGRAPGGRMATRRVEVDGAEHVVDVGASYLVSRDDGFSAVVDEWHRRGLARPWTDTMTTLDDAGAGSKQGPVRWAGTRGLTALVADLAADLDVRSAAVGQVAGRTDGAVEVDGVRARAVVLAVPDPQAARLLGPSLPAASAAVADRVWEPVLALWATWPGRWWAPLDAAFVSDSDVLSFVADDGSRRGDAAPVLTAHTTPRTAHEHLDDPDGARPAVLAELVRLLGRGLDVPAPLQVGVKRWTFARPASGRAEPFHLGSEPVGVCGDGWGPRPGVEQAWVSGDRLGQALASRLSPRPAGS